MKRSAPLFVALLAAGCATTEPQVDPVKLRLDDLDSRVGRIDRIIANDSLLQMTNRIEAQQQEIRLLHGQLEELQNENGKLRKEQHDLYADLNKRLEEASAAAAAASAAARAAKDAATAVAANTLPPAAVGDEQTLYNRALDQLKARDYGAAAESFRVLASAYPTGQLADNTQYWLGEAYYVTQEYDQAAAAFQRVLANWPNSRKAPDALLKLGYTQLEQGRPEVGRATLQQVVARYPEADAAKLAAERLAKLPKP